MTVLADNPMQVPLLSGPLCDPKADADLPCRKQQPWAVFQLVPVGRADSEAFLLAFYKEIKGVSGLMIMMHQMESLPCWIMLNHL